MTQTRKPENSPKPGSSETAAPCGYQIMTMHGTTGVSQAFATLAGAQRALPTVRQVYPDAFITELSGPGVHGG